MWRSLFLETTDYKEFKMTNSERFWKKYQSHFLIAIPSIPRVLDILWDKPTSDNVDEYVFHCFLILQWGKIMSSDHKQNIV